MDFKLWLEMENDCFQPENGPEIARQLREVAREIEARGHVNAGTLKVLRDPSGNRIGAWAVRGDWRN